MRIAFSLCQCWCRCFVCFLTCAVGVCCCGSFAYQNLMMDVSFQRRQVCVIGLQIYGLVLLA